MNSPLGAARFPNSLGPYPMIKPKSIAQIIAELVVEGGIPLKAVALVGELITLDARISDYPNGPMKRNSLEEIERAAETYDMLLKKAESLRQGFLESADRQDLVQKLSLIKDILVVLL